MRRIARLALLGCLIANPAPADDADARAWFREQGYAAPTADRIVACHGYGCARRMVLGFEPGLAARVSAAMAAGRTSAAAERQAIGEAVRLYTSFLAERFGGPPDEPRSPPSRAGQHGQMDCLDSTANTLSLLLILQARGLLTYHEVERPQARGFLLDGRWPHVTAVLSEKAGGASWAVDAWPYAPGHLPDILPLKAWFAAS
jgi:hypothetical protein